jgi:hypothetical protein
MSPPLAYVALGAFKEPPKVAPLVLILDPTVWLDGARLPTPVSHPPSLLSGLSVCPPKPTHGGKGGACTTLEVNHWSLIQGKEGGIQVLAGLAPSS